MNNEKDRDKSFYDQDEQSLRRSSLNDQEEPTLRRHQADDEQQRRIFLNKKKQATQPIQDEESTEKLSRTDQKKRALAEENERKTQELSKKLNRVIWILIGLIVLVYLFMRFVNF